MPDTFSHTIVGIAACLSWDMRDRRSYILTVGASLLPDLDSFTRWHRALLHSLPSLILVFIVLLVALRKLGYARGKRVLISLQPFIHVTLDVLTGGIPVKILFPLDYSVQLGGLLSGVVRKLLLFSPYGYYVEVIRVNLVILLFIVCFIVSRRLVGSPKSN